MIIGIDVLIMAIAACVISLVIDRIFEKKGYDKMPAILTLCATGSMVVIYIIMVSILDKIAQFTDKEFKRNLRLFSFQQLRKDLL